MPWTIVMDVISLAVLMSTVFGMTYCYYTIVVLFLNTQRKVLGLKNLPFANPSALVSQADSTSVAAPIVLSKMNYQTFDILSAREKRLIVTAISITGCFVFFWSPYMIMIMAEMIMGKRSGIDSRSSCPSRMGPVLFNLGYQQLGHQPFPFVHV